MSSTVARLPADVTFPMGRAFREAYALYAEMRDISKPRRFDEMEANRQEVCEKAGAHFLAHLSLPEIHRGDSYLMATSSKAPEEKGDPRQLDTMLIHLLRRWIMKADGQLPEPQLDQARALLQGLESEQEAAMTN